LTTGFENLFAEILSFAPLISDSLQRRGKPMALLLDL